MQDLSSFVIRPWFGFSAEANRRFVQSGCAVGDPSGAAVAMEVARAAWERATSWFWGSAWQVHRCSVGLQLGLPVSSHDMGSLMWLGIACFGLAWMCGALRIKLSTADAVVCLWVIGRLVLELASHMLYHVCHGLHVKHYLSWP